MQTKLIMALLVLGLVLAETGQIRRATLYIANLAVEAQKHDVVSLGQWNRALNSSNSKRPK